jgi:hypothetical protein
MPIRSTTHSKKTLKPGALAFIPGYSRKTLGGKNFAVCIRISARENDYWRAVSANQISDSELYFGAVMEIDDRGSVIFPGDLGIRGWCYDNRAQQCFTTRKACEAAIKRWKGKHPNFIVEIVK